MCGIVGSFDLVEIKRLYSRVAERGTVRQSLTGVYFDTGGLHRCWVDTAVDTLLDTVDTDYLSLDVDEPTSNIYYILHVQSPTGMVSKVHPASPHRDPDMNIHLWHNGMMDARVQFLKYKDRWDTEVLRDAIVDVGLKSTVENFEGSFACIAAGTDVSQDYKIICFRNRISPLFYRGSSVCSIKENLSWERVPPGIVFGIIPSGLEELISFTNEYNPFGV